ncbi:MAG TPA: riboflavin synthase [Chloroflexota bacterium]|nr:riboflavin synthase [Chloroflexota bacterium]
MFTGIVEEVGRVVAVDLADSEAGLIIEAGRSIEGLQPGDSIAVNGTCLTVTRNGRAEIAVGVMPETLRRTNLGRLASGGEVNLERPLQPDSRLGGHFVQGHVDGTGTVAAVEPDGDARSVRIETSPAILRYIVEKGFVALDGVSLTVTAVTDRDFSVALVPYTQQHIASGLLRPGHPVNIEVDILAKYVEKLVVH